MILTHFKDFFFNKNSGSIIMHQENEVDLGAAKVSPNDCAGLLDH